MIAKNHNNPNAHENTEKHVPFQRSFGLCSPLFALTNGEWE